MREQVEEFRAGGRRIWRLEDGSHVVEGWPTAERYESLEIVLHLLGLEKESPALARLNRKLVLGGSQPIPVRDGYRVTLDEDD